MCWNVILLGNNFQSFCVVGVFVCDEDRSDAGKRGLNDIQSFFNGAGADARVEKEFCVRGFYIYAIAGRAGIEGVRRDINHDILRKHPKDERKAR